MSVVIGKDVVFRLKEGLIACARSSSLVTSTSLIETTTKGDGQDSTWKPQKNTTTGSFEGVAFLGEANKIGFNDLREKQLNHELIEGASIERRSEDGLKYYKDVFNFYITSLTDTGAAGDFNTFQMELQVNGKFTINITDNDFDLNFTVGSLGATSFHIIAAFSGGVTWDLSIDGGGTYTTGLTSSDYTVSGLVTGTKYKVVRRIHSLSGKTYVMPPITVQTL